MREEFGSIRLVPYLVAGGRLMAVIETENSAV